MPKTLTIGVLVDWIRPMYQYDILSGIQEEADKQGVNLLCFIGGGLDTENFSQKNHDDLYRFIHKNFLDHLIILAGVGYETNKARYRAFLQSLKPLPVLLVAHQIKGYSSALIDSRPGLKELTLHMIRKHNRRKLAFVCGPDGVYDAESRLAAFREALQECAIPLNPDLVFRNGEFLFEDGHEAVRKWIDDLKLVPGHDFDAVLAANDAMAFGALQELVKRKVSIPGQVSLGGFDDSELSQGGEIPLSTVRQPCRKLGRKALEAALRMSDQPTVDYVSTQTIIRRSCGCRELTLCSVQTTLPAFDQQTLMRDFLAQKERLLSEIRQYVIFSSNEEQAEILTQRFIDACQRLLQDGQTEHFITEWEACLSAVEQLGEELGLWHEALSSVRSWLMGHASPSLRFQELKSGLELGFVVLSRSMQQSFVKRTISVQMYLGNLRLVEESLKISLNMKQLLESVYNGLRQLDFRSFYLFLYNRPQQTLHDFRLELACKNGQRLVLSRQDAHFSSYAEIVESLLTWKQPYTYYILPLVYQDTRYGFLLLDRGINAHARLAYENISHQLSSTLMASRLLIETRTAYEQLARTHTELEKTNQQLAATEKELKQELRVAQTIQHSLLPRQLSHKDYQIAAHMLTAISVGGDYYDVIHTAGRDWIVVGDVSGHGVHAGLVMMMVQTSIHLILKQNPQIEPHKLLSLINTVLTENIRRLGEEKYMTILVLACEEDGRFLYSGMHLPMLIYRCASGQVEMIFPEGMWLGLLDRIDGMNKDKSLRLEAGDCLLLYTDGITEAQLKTNKERTFSHNRLQERFQQLGELPPQEIIDHLLADLQDYDCADDVTLLILKRR